MEKVGMIEMGIKYSASVDLSERMEGLKNERNFLIFKVLEVPVHARAGVRAGSHAHEFHQVHHFGRELDPHGV